MPQTYEDDLFNESTMSFGQHLAELRVCLFRAIIGLALGVVLGVAVGKQVVQFINDPLERALQRHYLDKAKKTIKERYPGLSPELLEVVINERKIFEDVSIEPGAFWEDLRNAFPDSLGAVRIPEYRIQPADIADPIALCTQLQKAKQADASPDLKRLWGLLTTDQKTLVGNVAAAGEATAAEKAELAQALNALTAKSDLYDEAAFQANKLPEDLVKGLTAADATSAPRLNWMLLHKVLSGVKSPHPFLMNVRMWKDITDVHWVRPISIGTTEAITFWMKASMITGLVISSPWVFYQLWTFIGAGLYPHERRYVHIYMPISLALFLAGAALTFFLVFDKVLEFLLWFNEWLGIEPSPRVSDWMSFVLWMPLAFGISFQMPLVMLFLDRVGIVTVQTFKSSWRIAILSIFIVAAILNPAPDPYSLLLMAAPLILLYFGGIGLCLWGKKKPSKWD